MLKLSIAINHADRIEIGAQQSRRQTVVRKQVGMAWDDHLRVDSLCQGRRLSGREIPECSIDHDGEDIRPVLRNGIADYLVRERAYVAAAGAELATFAPFRKNLSVEPD